MAAGAFVVGRDNEESPRDIVFHIAANYPGEIPQDQLELVGQVARTLTVLRALYVDGKSQFPEYFSRILSLSRAGTVGSTAQPSLALSDLAVIRDEILFREGARVKNRHMMILGRWAVLLGLPGAVVWSVSRSVPDLGYPLMMGLGSFGLLWMGCMGGVWLSFGARKQAFSFEDLGRPEQDFVQPGLRLVFAGLLTVILGLLFVTGAVAVKVGAVSTDALLANDAVSLLVGSLCGFSEMGLTSKVAKQASAFLDIA
jgi:hypothetical protein